MTETDGIVAYLREREEAVAGAIVSMNTDLEMIHRLLREASAEPAFMVHMTPPSSTSSQSNAHVLSDEQESTHDERETDSERRASRYGRPVRAMVQSVLESDNRAWASAEVQEAVRAKVGPERVDPKLKATVRTALWTLRKHGQSTQLDDGRHLATKWRTDTETPAVTGVSGTAPTNGLA